MIEGGRVDTCQIDVDVLSVSHNAPHHLAPAFSHTEVSTQTIYHDLGC
jgi:hypothetical protein